MGWKRVVGVVLAVGILLSIGAIGASWASTRIRSEQMRVYYRSDLKILVDGKLTYLEVEPLIVDPGWIMVPVEFVSRELGARVAWDDPTSTFSISTPSAELQRLRDELAQTRDELARTRDELAYLRRKVANLGEPLLGVYWRWGTDPVVASVINNGPAQAAGILAGSRITYVNGVQVLTRDEFSAEIDKYMPTDEVDITFIYAQQYRTVRVILGVRTPYSQ